MTLLLLLALCTITPAQNIPGSIHYRYTRSVGGWLPTWNDQDGNGPGWKSVQANADNIDEVSFFDFAADPKTGDLAPPAKNMDFSNLVHQVGWLHTREVAGFFTVTQFNHVHDILTNPASLNNLIANIVQTSNLYGFDGVDIDFEDFKNVDPMDSERYTNFINQLADAMHAQTDFYGYPKMVIATVLPETQRGKFAFIDYAALASSRVDRVRVMAYDEYYPGSHSAGAGSPLPWYGQVAAYVKSLAGPNEWKFTLGIPGYAYKWPVAADSDWSTIGHGSSVTYPQAVALIAEHGASPSWDKASGTPYITYRAWYTPPAVWPPPAPAASPPTASSASPAPATPSAAVNAHATASAKTASALSLPSKAPTQTASAATAPASSPAKPAAAPQPGLHTWIAYYEDTQSWKMKVQNVLLNSHMNGLSEWALGYEDPAVWPMLQKSLAPLYPIYGAIGMCYWRYGGGARYGDCLGPEHSTGVAEAGTLDGYAGREQDFEYARIYYKWGSPRAYVLDGDLLNQYLAAGGPSGSLGFPVSDPVVEQDGKLTMQFEHGTLSTSAARAEQPQ